MLVVSEGDGVVPTRTAGCLSLRKLCRRCIRMEWWSVEMMKLLGEQVSLDGVEGGTEVHKWDPGEIA